MALRTASARSPVARRTSYQSRAVTASAYATERPVRSTRSTTDDTGPLTASYGSSGPPRSLEATWRARGAGSSSTLAISGTSITSTAAGRSSTAGRATPAATGRPRAISDGSGERARAPRLIVASARLLGWRVAHFRPAWTQRGWRTAGSYDAQGWPDLVLVRERVVFAEVKTDRGRLRPEQEGWLGSLRHAGAEVYVWRPEDWTSGEVEDVLRRRAA